MRLIDADVLLIVLRDYWAEGTSETGMEVLDKIIVTLEHKEEDIVRCKDCRWGREVCGNIECSVDRNLPPEYHGYEWFCPNGEKWMGE